MTEKELTDLLHKLDLESKDLQSQREILYSQLEKIEADEKLVDFEIAKMAAQYNMEEAKVREILGDNIDGLQREIRQRLILDFLVDNNK